MLYRSADVVVNVEDLNDNSPVFSDNPFTGEIAHDDTLGNKIVTVRHLTNVSFRSCFCNPIDVINLEIH